MAEFIDAYPQHKIAQEKKAELEFAGTFLDWLDETGRVIGVWIDKRGDDEELAPERLPKDRLIAEFLGIDYAEFNREKDRMLEAIRKAAE